MKVLVTGATSGLGRNAAQWLIDQGHDVLATGRNVHAGAALQKQGAVFVPMDLAQTSSQEMGSLMQGVDWVWHCAALSSPWGRRHDFYTSNTQVTNDLAVAAGQVGVARFVHISTPSIYFDFQNQKNIPETFCAARFANAYAWSKAKAEQAILVAQKNFLQTQYIMLRPRGIFGPHDRVILPRVIDQIQRGRGVLKLPRGGAVILDLTFVHNVVHAMVLASTRDGLPAGAAYNITNHEPEALAGMLTQLFRNELGVDFTIKALPYMLFYGVAGVMEMASKYRGKEPLLTRYTAGALNYDMTLSSHKARTELGYEPIYSLAQGFRQTAVWLKGGV